jgi:hypothetical protein
MLSIIITIGHECKTALSGTGSVRGGGRKERALGGGVEEDKSMLYIYI